jgi:hypothetical protein
MRASTLLLVLWAVAASAATGGAALPAAATTFKSGGDLLSLCQSDLDTDSAQCNGYIMALNDAAALLTTELNRAPLYCASRQATEERMRLAYVRFAEKRPYTMLRGSAAASFTTRWSRRTRARDDRRNARHCRAVSSRPVLVATQCSRPRSPSSAASLSRDSLRHYETLQSGTSGDRWGSDVRPMDGLDEAQSGGITRAVKEAVSARH